MTVGRKINRARRAKGLSLREMGRLIGVSGSAVAQWESGSGITPAHIVSISEVLELPVAELMPVEIATRDLTTADPQEILLVRKFRELSPQLRETHLRLILLHSKGDQEPG